MHHFELERLHEGVDKILDEIEDRRVDVAGLIGTVRVGRGILSATSVLGKDCEYPLFGRSNAITVYCLPRSSPA